MGIRETNKGLIQLLKKGDVKAFDTIYKQYCRRLYGFVFRYVKQEEDAEEIVQEVFIKVWENRYKIDIYSSFESFLFTITYNSAISLLRKRINEKRYIEHFERIQEVQNSEKTIGEIQFKELNEKVNQLLDQLTPRQREIFQLSRFKGLTHNEIAKKLGISVNTVKNHLVTSLKFLKNNLDNNLLISVLFVSLFL